MERDEISRRIRAARALAQPTEAELAARQAKADRDDKKPRPIAGITVDELAARINLDGLGAKTIGNLERGEGPALRPQLREIADACGLPYEFFTMSFATGANDIERRLAAIEEFIREDVVPRLPSEEEEDPIFEPAAQPHVDTARTSAPARRQRRQAP